MEFFWRLKGQRGDKHVLDECRCRHKVLQLKIEYTLQPLHAQGSQFGQLTQQTTEVVLLLLRLGVIGDMITQATDDLHLQQLHLLRLA